MSESSFIISALAYPTQVPQFDIEADDRRSPWVWPTLYALFALLFVVAAKQYFGQASTKNDLYLQSVAELRTAVLLNGTPHDLPKPLLDSRSKDVKVSELYVAEQFVAEKPIVPKDLTPISSSTDRKDKAFATIFSSPHLSQAEANTLRAELPNGSVVYEVAKAAASQKAGDSKALQKVFPERRMRVARLAWSTYLLGAVLGVALWVAFGYFRSRGELKSLGHPAGELSRSQADSFAARTLQYILAIVAISFFVGAAAGGRKTGLPDSLVELINSIALAVIIFVFPWIKVGGKIIPLPVQGWHTRNLGKNLLWGLGAAVANIPVFIMLTVVGAAIFQFLPEQAHPMVLEATTTKNFLTVLMIGISASICAPIFEETMFRGTLLPALSSTYGSVVAGVVVNSVFFAMLHPTGPPSWFALAWVGALSSMLMYQTRSIVPSITLHFLFNTFQLLLALAIT